MKHLHYIRIFCAVVSVILAAPSLILDISCIRRGVGVWNAHPLLLIAAVITNLLFLGYLAGAIGLYAAEREISGVVLPVGKRIFRSRERSKVRVEK